MNQFQAVDAEAYPVFTTNNPRIVFPAYVQAYGEVLYDIAREKGHILPEDVVGAARPPGAVMHGFFEWDDAIAAEEYRKEQARGAIRSIDVQIRREPDGEREVEVQLVRAFLSVTPTVPFPEYPGRQVYRNLPDVMENDDQRREHLAEVLDRLQAMLAKHALYEELDPIRDAIRDLIVRLG